MLRAALLALVCLSLAVAGCGSGAASGGEDPASAVPANAAIYVDATVRPDGEVRDDALAPAGKVLRPQIRRPGSTSSSRTPSPSPTSPSSTTRAT